MNKSDLATVLAALRYWQRTLMSGSVAEDLSPDHFDDGVKPLTVEEIDCLAERLNCATPLIPAQVKIQATRKFKVWVYVEAIDEKVGQYLDLMDLGFLTPPSLGEFGQLEETWRFVLGLPGCRQDDTDMAALQQAAQIEKQVWESPLRQSPRYEKEGG